MPYPGQRLKLVPYGTINGSQDWSTTLTVAPDVTPSSWDISDLAAITVDLEAYFHTWANAVKGAWYSSVHYVGLRAYYYAVSGDIATLVADAPHGTDVVGTGTIGLPTVTALVCTLKTDFPGRSFRGRSYMPLTAGGIDGAGELGSGDVDVVANAYQALLNSLNAYTNTGHSLASQQAVVASATAGLMTPIHSIKVDNQPDVQHRRSDKIAASYSKVLTV